MTAVAKRPAPAAAAKERAGTLTGTGTMIRFVLRRDRVRLPVWVLSISGFLVGMTSTLPDLYPTAADRQLRADLMANPAGRALTGPGYGLEDYTFGAMIAHEMLGFTAVFVALMGIFLVARHTRAEEELGRAELLRAGPLGVHALLVAALVVVGGATLLVGALVAVGLASLGIETVDWGGSLLFGAALASVGLVFVAGAALTAQVSEHARTASGLAGAALAAVFTLRAAGDLGDGTLSWLSPIGWAQATRAYVDGRWWPLLLSLGLAVGLAAGALALNGRRDLAAGLVRPRPGPAEGGRLLGSAAGLAVRLHRASLVWWAVGLALFGATYGFFVGEAERFIEESPVIEDIFVVEGAAVIDGFLGMILSLLAMTCAIQAAIAVQRLRSEEVAGRAEPVLATPVSRAVWAASHLGVGVAGSALLLVVAALSFGVSAAVALEDAGVVARVVSAVLGYLPAVWVVAALALAVFGVAPQATAWVWALPAHAALIQSFGGLVGAPRWAYWPSPFHHLPLLPAEPFALLPVLLVTGAAAALAAAGFAALARRDIQSGA